MFLFILNRLFVCVIFVKFKYFKVMLWLVKSLLHLYAHAHRHDCDCGHVQLKKILNCIDVEYR